MSQFDFLGYPNEFYVASAAIVGASTGLLTIRTIYYLKRHDAEHKHDEAGKLGLRVMRVYGLIALFVSMVLLARSDTPMPGDFWATDALNKSWWAAIRATFMGFVAAALFMYETHWALRAFVVLLLPLLTSIAMVSEIDLASEVNCIETEVCEDTGHLQWLKFLVWRELFAIWSQLQTAFLAVWLLAHFGVTKNLIIVPRQEHREFRVLVSDDGL